MSDHDPDTLEKELTTDLDDLTRDRPRGMPLHTRILLGLVIGAVAGVAGNGLLGGEDPRVTWVVRQVTEPIGSIFLRLLLMIVVPLVFSSLVLGVAGLGDIRRLGRVGIKTLAFTLVLSAISVLIGLGLANAIRPGERIPPDTAAELESRYGSEAEERVVAATAGRADGESAMMQVVETIVPANPIASLAGQTPNMLHLMFFALIVGVAATLLSERVMKPFLGVLESVYAFSVKIIDIVMRLAPYAVACLLFTNTAQFGLDVLVTLVWFVGTVLVGLGLHMFVVYPAAIVLLARMSPIQFFRRTKTALLTAFSTSSSNATLPTALRVSEENLEIPRGIGSFVLTVGATANQNGTALYEGVTVLFLAQLAGVDLGIGAQLMVLYLAILGGVGTAGVPSGSIPFIIVVLATVGVNPALIAIILGVDRILDMCRTTLNVAGDLAAAAYVARSEGHVLPGDLRRRRAA